MLERPYCRSKPRTKAAGHMLAARHMCHPPDPIIAHWLSTPAVSCGEVPRRGSLGIVVFCVCEKRTSCLDDLNLRYGGIAFLAISYYFGLSSF